MTISEKYLIGYLAGIIHGISLRDDVPQQVKDTCSMAYKEYEEFYRPSNNAKCSVCQDTKLNLWNEPCSCGKDNNDSGEKKEITEATLVGWVKEYWKDKGIYKLLKMSLYTNDLVHFLKQKGV